MIKPLLSECKECKHTAKCVRTPDGKMTPPKGKECKLFKRKAKKKTYVKKSVIVEIMEVEETKPEYWLAGSMIEIAEVIYNYMEVNGLNQSDVAKKMGLDRTYISRLLNCNVNPTLKTIIRIAMVVGMDKPCLKLEEGK